MGSQFPQRARDQIDYATKLGINIIAYATGREVNLKDKLEEVPILVQNAKNPLDRFLEIPKLAHAGGADDAPNAWRNVLNQFRFEMKMEVNPRTVLIEPQIDLMSKYPMLFTHGRQKFEWTVQQRADIREYLEQRGGFLFVDCICAAQPFAESFKHEMKEIFPTLKLEPVPPNHPMLTKQYSGFDLHEVTIRLPNVNAQGVATFVEQKSAPLLEMLKLENGRVAVVFSPYDLSCAMESAAGSQCRGYTKEDASRIGVNVILFALSQPESGAAPTDR